MKLINLTPHEVRILDEKGNLIVGIPSSRVARAEQHYYNVGLLMVGGADIPCVHTRFGSVELLPEPSEGVAYIVSNITVQAAKATGRSVEDLFFPGGDPVRDANGQIIGVRALAHAGVGHDLFEIY